MGQQVAGGAPWGDGAARPDRAQRAAQVEAVDHDPGQPACCEVLGDREFAQHCGPGSGEHCRPDRRSGGQGQRDGRLAAGGPGGACAGQRGRERGGQRVAGARSFLPAHQGGRGQFRGAQRLAAPCPRVVGADDHDEGVVPDNAAAQPLRAPGSLDESQVCASLTDLLGHGFAVRGGEHDLGGLPAAVLCRCLQGHQPPGQQLLGNGQAGADP